MINSHKKFAQAAKLGISIGEMFMSSLDWAMYVLILGGVFHGCPRLSRQIFDREL
jgi:hypothetical protein